MHTILQHHVTAIDDVVRFGAHSPVRMHRVGPRPPVHPQLMRAAVLHPVLDGLIEREPGLDVMTIEAIQAPRFKRPASDELNELVREDDVDVGGQDERTTRAADADVLGDHLKERQRFGMRQARVNFRRYLDETIGTLRIGWQR